MAAAGGCLATTTMAVVALTFQSVTAVPGSSAATRAAGTATADARARMVVSTIRPAIPIDRIGPPHHGTARCRSAGGRRSGGPDLPRSVGPSALVAVPPSAEALGGAPLGALSVRAASQRRWPQPLSQAARVAWPPPPPHSDSAHRACPLRS